MRKVLRWAGIMVGGLLGIVLLAALVLFAVGTSRLNATHEPPDRLVAAAADSASIARGEHVMRIHSCQFCHGERLEGQEFLDVPPAYAVASNLTPGKGGVGQTYSGEDWDRAVRYGIRPDGKMLLPFMPYHLFNNLNDTDAAHLAAYLESLPAVDNELPSSRAKFLGKIIMGTRNALPGKRPQAIRTIEPAPTPEYGAYLASTTCVECHGPRLEGGKHPDPSAPPAPALPPTSSWTDEQFALAMRTGRAPGRQLSEHMPWRYYAHLTDTELAALRAYIRTITTGVRETD